MAASSLTNFTVPLAGGASATAQGLLMPKLKFRFRATFLNFGISSNQVELTKQVANIKRPQVEFETITLDVYNSKAYLAGKPSWQTVTVNLRDDASGMVTQMVGEQLQKQFDFMQQASAASGADYKFTLTYDMLDGGNGADAPVVLETWTMYGCFLSTVDYGEMNYSTNEAAEIALTVRYDNALQSVGVGSPVPRSYGATVTG
jgi:hypothetical protein